MNASVCPLSPDELVDCISRELAPHLPPHSTTVHRLQRDGHPAARYDAVFDTRQSLGVLCTGTHFARRIPYHATLRDGMLRLPASACFLRDMPSVSLVVDPWAKPLTAFITHDPALAHGQMVLVRLPATPDGARLALALARRVLDGY